MVDVAGVIVTLATGPFDVGVVGLVGVLDVSGCVGLPVFPVFPVFPLVSVPAVVNVPFAAVGSSGAVPLASSLHAAAATAIAANRVNENRVQLLRCIMPPTEIVVECLLIVFACGARR